MTFKDFLNEATYNFTTGEGVAKFVLDNMKTLHFGKDGNVEYSRKHNGYLYSGESKLKGVKFETSWSHKSAKFHVEFTESNKQANEIYNEIAKNKKVLLDAGIDCFIGEYSMKGINTVVFTDSFKMTNRLISEFADSIIGYSQEDL